MFVHPPPNPAPACVPQYAVGRRRARVGLPVRLDELNGMPEVFELDCWKFRGSLLIRTVDNLPARLPFPILHPVTADFAVTIVH